MSKQRKKKDVSTKIKDSKIRLLSSDEEEENELKINKSYANKYDTWRSNEEMQKCKFSLQYQTTRPRSCQVGPG